MVFSGRGMKSNNDDNENRTHTMIWWYKLTNEAENTRLLASNTTINHYFLPLESSSEKAKNYYETLKLDPFFVILLQHTIGWLWNIVLRRYLYNNTAGTDDGEFIVNMNVKH